MNCPYCKRYFGKKLLAIDHINKVHLSELEKSGMDAPQSLYFSTHGTLHGKCMCGCGKPTDWNYRTGKPYKVSTDPKCRERLNNRAEKNLYNAKGITKSTMMSDMEHQKEMQHHRPTAGKYTFHDGGAINYLSKLELNFLQFCDTVMEFSSNMIQEPPETIVYHDTKEDRDRYYIPDYYLPDYNLLIEIKDGGDHPNTNPAFIEETKYKVKMKDDAMRSQSKYNYIKIVDKNYGPFLETLFKIVELGRDDSPKQNAVIVISESACIEPITQEPVDNIMIESNQFYVVVTKIPMTEIVTSISITGSIIGEHTYTLDEDNILVDTNPMNHKFIDEDVEIYRYIGNDSNANKCLHEVQDMVNQYVFGDFFFENVMTKNDIKYHFGAGLTNNNHRQSDFIMIYKCHAERK